MTNTQENLTPLQSQVLDRFVEKIQTLGRNLGREQTELARARGENPLGSLSADERARFEKIKAEARPRMEKNLREAMIPDIVKLTDERCLELLAQKEAN